MIRIRPRQPIPSYTPALLLLIASVGIADEKALPIGSRRELFVDHFLIDQLDGARLALHHPKDEGLVLKFDQPWERAGGAQYGTVIKDGAKYRLYYRAFGEKPPGTDCRQVDCTIYQVTCYAESDDGIHWMKPKLGLYERYGTKDNNIILADLGSVNHNFSPFIDTRPDCPADQKYKSLSGGMEWKDRREGTKIIQTGLFAYVSSDGIHWRPLAEGPVMTRGAFDSQNVSFWSAIEEKYVCYFRDGVGGHRSISRATSDAFIHWSPPTPMTYSDTGTTRPPHHMYTNQTAPYFRAPHIYVATPARFMQGRQVVSAEQARAIDFDPARARDCSDAMLMSTRGGTLYDRTFLDAFIRPDIGPQNWTTRTNYPLLNFVQTGPHEMSIYVDCHASHKSEHYRRFSLRLDGFASLYASHEGGQMLSEPLTFSGEQLTVNFATSAAGSVRVEIQDARKTPVSGFTLNDCDEIIGNEIERVVTWKGKSNVGQLSKKPVRLRFVLKDADLYSLQFRSTAERPKRQPD